MRKCPGCSGSRRRDEKSCAVCLKYLSETEDHSISDDPCDTRLTLLLTTTDYQHAHMIERRLEVLGIACYLNSSGLSGVWGEAEVVFGESRLYVPETLWKKACQAVRAELISS